MLKLRNYTIQLANKRNYTENQQVTIISFSDNDHYDILKIRQDNIIEKNDTLMEHALVPVGSMVAIKREYSGPWIHNTTACCDENLYNGRSYRIRIMKIGRIVTRTTRHIMTTPISTEQYLRDHMSKQNYLHTSQDGTYRQ